MKKLFLLFLLLPFYAFPSFLKGKISLINGNEIEAYVEIPDSHYNKKLYYRLEQNSSKLHYTVEEVKSFYVINKHNEQLDFISMYLAAPKWGSKSIDDVKIDKNKHWFLIIRSGKINFVSAISEQTMNYGSGSIPVDVMTRTFYIYRPEKNYCLYFFTDFSKEALVINHLKALKLAVKKHLDNDCPGLSEKFSNKDIKEKGYEYIFDLLAKECGN